MKILLTCPFAEHDDVELTAEQALKALVDNKLYYCKERMCERGKGEMVFHVPGGVDWDQVVAETQVS